MTNKGFTLIELVLVIAILGVSIGVTTDVLISVIRGYNKTQVMNEIEQQANFVSMKIEKELRSAKDITTPATSGQSGTTLVFINDDNETITYSLTGDILQRNGDAVTSSQQPSGVKVACGSPNCFELKGTTPQIVRITLVFTQASPSPLKVFQGDISIDSTIVLRSTY